METGVRGLNGQHAQQLVEMAQCPVHVTVTILVNNMAACLVRGGEMTNCSVFRDIAQVCLYGLPLLLPIHK